MKEASTTNQGIAAMNADAARGLLPSDEMDEILVLADVALLDLPAACARSHPWLFISGEHESGEQFEPKELEKIVLLPLAAIALELGGNQRSRMCRLFLCVVAGTALLGSAQLMRAQGGSSKPAAGTELPVGSEQAADADKPEAPVATEPANAPFSGSYQATFNLSVLGDPDPSLGHRLNLSYEAPFGGSFDGRAEYYIDGSYNADPPGILRHNINEPKVEGQLMYNRRIRYGFGLTAGFLYHHNFRFPDDYYWAVAGLTYSLPIGKALTLSASALGEKKIGGVRPFYDLSGTLEYRFAPKWNAQLSYHRYENVGQFDPEPTQKLEYELALNRAVTDHQSVGVSFFRHIQFHAPNDQFSFIKLKYNVSF